MITLADVLRLSSHHARRLSSPTMDADDLLQEGAIIGWRLLKNVNPALPDEIGFAYLHKCIRRRMLGVIRESRRRTPHIAGPIEGMGEAVAECAMNRMCHHDTPEAHTSIAEQIGRIDWRPNDRTVIDLMLIGRANGQQAASVMGVDKSRVSQILKRVTERMTAEVG